jgi:hypothetical protein
VVSLVIALLLPAPALSFTATRRVTSRYNSALRHIFYDFKERISLSRLQLHLLLESTSPLVLCRQLRRVGNVAALPELHNLSFASVVSDDSKRSIGKVHSPLGQSMHTARPTDHVDKATLVAILIGYTEGVDEAVLELRKALAKSCVKAVVQI